VSGNTVADLQARWDADTLALKPDVLSILIGVNDIWHTLMGQYNGTPEKYQRGYQDLLEGTRTALPHVHLVILEPFVLRTGAVTAKWFPEFDEFRTAASRVAHDMHATFIPLHEMFQQLARKTVPSYWLMDGVHPTLAGHAAITRRWLDAVRL
jgi:lysophospholipase L1-like esterase